MTILIESSVWIGLERRGLPLTKLGRMGSVEPPVIATVTVAESLGGVHRAHSPDRRAKRLAFIEQILAGVEIVPFDLASAKEYVRVSATLTAAGTSISQLDLLAAACALAHGHGVFTDNLSEFSRVPGLTFRRPTWPS